MIGLAYSTYLAGVKMQMLNFGRYFLPQLVVSFEAKAKVSRALYFIFGISAEIYLCYPQ
jgi:hypothetical protein